MLALFELIVSLTAGVLSAPWVAQLPADSGSLGVRTARFARGDRTVVDGLVQVPLAMLSPASPGPNGIAAFTLEAEVMDSGGQTLSRSSWTRRLPAGALALPGALTVESLALALGPGTYTLRVSVQDSASGLRHSLAQPIVAYRTRPAVSDLLVGSGFRSGAGPDSVARPGEVRTALGFIVSAPEVVLRPAAARLYFYCEVYRDTAARDTAVSWRVSVRGADGRVLVQPPQSSSPVVRGVGVASGSVDLAGLPPGRYALAFESEQAGDVVARSAPFRMTGFEADQRAEAQAAGAVEGDLYERMTEAQLDSLYQPLVYLMTSDQFGIYPGLTVEGKRRFLRAFWRERDTNRATTTNEAEADFYARVAEANRRFREGGSAEVPGWRTDRGRIFILKGDPDEVLRRPQAGPAPPWEAWKYSRGRLRKYVFMDQTRLGNYVLIHSDDRLERSMPNWEDMIGTEAVREIDHW